MILSYLSMSVSKFWISFLIITDQLKKKVIYQWDLKQILCSALAQHKSFCLLRELTHRCPNPCWTGIYLSFRPVRSASLTNNANDCQYFWHYRVFSVGLLFCRLVPLKCWTGEMPRFKPSQVVSKWFSSRKPPELILNTTWKSLCIIKTSAVRFRMVWLL